MSKIVTLARKELATYFKSPMAYIVLVAMLSVFNVFFFLSIRQSHEADLRDVFKVMEFMLLFFVPLLTMKVFSEEKFSGTIEFLMTTPTTNTAIVLGKYVGGMAFFTLIIGLTSSYYIILESFGQPDRWAMLIGYAGLWLEGALLMAIGMLTSSWTRNQIIAAISSYVIVFFLFFSRLALPYVQGLAKQVIRHSCLLTHSENFFVGIVATDDLVYYVSGILLCLGVTRLSIESRLWR